MLRIWGFDCKKNARNATKGKAPSPRALNEEVGIRCGLSNSPAQADAGLFLGPLVGGKIERVLDGSLPLGWGGQVPIAGGTARLRSLGLALRTGRGVNYAHEITYRGTKIDLKLKN